MKYLYKFKRIFAKSYFDKRLSEFFKKFCYKFLILFQIFAINIQKIFQIVSIFFVKLLYFNIFELVFIDF